MKLTLGKREGMKNNFIITPDAANVDN